MLCFNHSPSCGYLVSAFGVLFSVFTVRLAMFVCRVSVYGVPPSVFDVCVSDVGCWMVFDVWLMGSVVALGCSFAGNRGSRVQLFTSPSGATNGRTVRGTNGRSVA